MLPLLQRSLSLYEGRNHLDADDFGGKLGVKNASIKMVNSSPWPSSPLVISDPLSEYH